MYIKLIIVHSCMEAQKMAVAVQMMRAYYVDGYNDHDLLLKQEFPLQKLLNVKCSFFIFVW